MKFHPIKNNQAPHGYINIAPGKPAHASSTYSPGFNAAKAVDGIIETAWGSTVTNTPQWLYIDLTEKTSIGGLALTWVPQFHATDFMIYISNDAKTWTMVYQKVKGTGGTEQLFGKGTCRYIGIYLTKKPNIAYGISELAIYREDAQYFENHRILNDTINTTISFTDVKSAGDNLIVKTDDHLRVYDPAHTLLSTITIPGTFHDYTIDGHYLYYTSADGITVIDMQTASHPQIINQIPLANSTNIIVNKSIAYVSHGTNRISAVDIRNMHNQPILNTIAEDNSIKEMCLAGNKLAVLIGASGYRINVYDVTTPDALLFYAVLSMNEQVQTITMDTDIIYTATHNDTPRHYLSAVDKITISDANNIIIERLHTLTGMEYILDLKRDGRYLYATYAEKTLSPYYLLGIIDTTNPAQKVAETIIPGEAFGFAITPRNAYVACGKRGLTVIDKTTPAALTINDPIPAFGDTKDIIMYGDYAITVSDDGIHIINTAMIQAPVYTSSILPGKSTMNYTAAAINDHYLYITRSDKLESGTYYDDLLIYDLTDITRPVLVNTMSLAELVIDETPHHIMIDDNRLFIYEWDGYKSHIISAYTITNGSTPQPTGIIGEWETDIIKAFDIQGNYAYVTGLLPNGTKPHLWIYDLTGTGELQKVGTLEFPPVTGLDDRFTITVNGTEAYIGCNGEQNTLYVADITDAATPRHTATITMPADINDIAVAGRYTYVANDSAGITIMNLTDPHSPLFLKTIDTPGTAVNLVVENDLVYAADYDRGLVIIGDR